MCLYTHFFTLYIYRAYLTYNFNLFFYFLYKNFFINKKIKKKVIVKIFKLKKKN